MFAWPSEVAYRPLAEDLELFAEALLLSCVLELCCLSWTAESVSGSAQLKGARQSAGWAPQSTGAEADFGRKMSAKLTSDCSWEAALAPT
mmetsp:Transcript_157858/g.483727  ORF Transcript_157858/g.483727 Transcript_157858/m.483727 type:complete len:90 (+) Transcript_157858:639-908(+)